MLIIKAVYLLVWLVSSRGSGNEYCCDMRGCGESAGLIRAASGQSDVSYKVLAESHVFKCIKVIHCCEVMVIIIRLDI